MSDLTTTLVCETGEIVKVSDNDPIVLPLITEESFLRDPITFGMYAHTSRSGKVYLYLAERDAVILREDGARKRNHKLISLQQAQLILNCALKASGEVSIPYFLHFYGGLRYDFSKQIEKYIPVAEKYGLVFEES